MTQGKQDHVFGAQRRSAIVAMIEAHGVVRIGDIVREFGVSRKTALRDLDLLDSEGRVDKVHGGAVAVVATPPATSDEPTTAPADHTGPTIGIVLPVVGHHNRTILRGAESVLQSHGAAVTVSTTGWTATAGPSTQIDELVGAGVAGLLVRPAPVPDDAYGVVRDWVERPPVPTVLIEDEPAATEQSAVWTVGTDDHRGVATSLRHLHDLGHRRIMLVTDGGAPRSREIRRLWRFCLQDAGLDDDLPVIDGATTPGWPLPTTTATDAILETLRTAEASAVVCHNDVPAFAIADRARRQGWSIPGDLSIVAYEDRVSTRATNPLTAVVLPGYDVGRVAAQALLEQIDAPQRRPRHIRIQPEFVNRASTGAV